MKEVTICSAYHSLPSMRYLEMNCALTDAINTKKNWQWFVTDNTPAEYHDKKVDESRFTVFRGTPLSEFQKSIEPWQEPLKTGMHVVEALNRMMRKIDTRFALVVDGDFFMIQKDWIERVIHHMKEQEIALLGSPWHPRWYKKIRYFPAMHVLFIDGDKIPLSEVDFSLQYKSADDVPAVKGVHESVLSHVPVMHQLFTQVKMRKLIGTSQDAGYWFYQKYKDSKVRHESLVPVFKPYSGDRPLERVLKISIDRLLPDRYSLTPKAGTYSTKGFKEYGLFDAAGEGWEEFMWQGKPFGFHMRNTGNYKRSKEETLRIVEPVIKAFTHNPVI